MCKALGHTNTTIALKYLDEDERAKHCLGSGGPAVNVVSEPGLYGLLLKSRIPAAQQFKRWVKQVVLPAIRKDGAYIKGEETAKTDDAIIALGMAAMQRKIDRLIPQAEGMDPGLVQNITVRDFVRKHGIVATKGQKTVLGQRASAASRVAGRWLRQRAGYRNRPRTNPNPTQTATATHGNHARSGRDFDSASSCLIIRSVCAVKLWIASRCMAARS